MCNHSGHADLSNRKDKLMQFSYPMCKLPLWVLLSAAVCLASLSNKGAKMNVDKYDNLSH